MRGIFERRLPFSVVGEGDGNFRGEEGKFGEEVCGDEDGEAGGEGFKQGEGESFKLGGVHEGVCGEEVAGNVGGPCDAVDGEAAFVCGAVELFGKLAAADPDKAGAWEFGVNFRDPIEPEQWSLLWDDAAYGEDDVLVGGDVEFGVDSGAGDGALREVEKWDAVDDCVDAGFGADECAEFVFALVECGDEDAGKFFEKAAGDPVAGGCVFGAEVFCVLGDVDGGEAVDASEASGVEQVEAVFEVLFVEMDDVGVQSGPFGCDAAGDAAAEEVVEGADAVVVGVCVGRTDDASDGGEERFELVHAFVRGHPKGDFVAALAQGLAEVKLVKFAAATGAGTAADEECFHLVILLSAETQRSAPRSGVQFSARAREAAP